MKSFVIGFLSTAFLIFSSVALFADKKPADGYQVVQSLDEQWLVYDREHKGYVPFLKEMHGTPQALYLELNVDSYKGYSLQIDNTQEVYVFIQAQLYKYLPKDQGLTLHIDSLGRAYKQGSILLSLYNKNGHTIVPTAAIVRKVSAAADSGFVQEKDITPLKPLTRSGLGNFVVIAALLISALYAFLWNYHPKAFNSYYSLRSMLSLSFKEDTVFISRPLSRISLLFIFAHSMLLSFLYILIQKSSEALSLNDRYLQAAVTFVDLMYYFIIATAVVFALIIAKYIFISLLGSLFNLTKVVHMHFYEYLLYSRVFYTIIVAAVFVIYVSYPTLLPQTIQEIVIVIVVFNFVRLFIINFALNKLTSVKNLYLFSYLCATELTPLLIGIKVLID